MPLATTLAGESVELFAAKAMHWPAARTVFVADPHWGKAAAFRAGGVAVSADPLVADLARLTEVLRTTNAARLVVLGDLFHAKASKQPAVLNTIADWRATVPDLNILLVRGNHDRAAGDPPVEWGFDCRPEPVIDPPFALKHFPGVVPGLYSLAGHIHPAVTLTGRGRERLKLPCFLFGPAGGLLPAFGGFTGTATVAPAPGDRAFVIADGEVIAVC